MMPSVVLKKMVISGFDKRAVDSDIADAIDFMVDKVLGNTLHYLASCHSYFQYVMGNFSYKVGRLKTMI